MEEFKIINKSNYSTVGHMLAKCRDSKRDFNIRLERYDNKWYMVYATKIDSSCNASNIISDKELQLEGGLYCGKEYSCPYCGRNSIVQCGECGRITCNDSKYFQCAYCGNSGEVNGRISSVHIENSLEALKKRKQ